MKIQKHYTFNTKIKPREKTEADAIIEERVMGLYIDRIIEIYNKEMKEEEKMVL